MKAVVMAGGAGSRLRPITIELPKPMITVINKPTIGHILSLLKSNGITEVIITVQYLANIIQDYFGEGNHLGMKITYCVEEDPLGTAGGIKQVQSLLDDTFMVISGDAITDFNLQEIINFHQKKKAKATITLYRVPNPLEFGIIITNKNSEVIQILEKPTWGEVISDTVNTGIYVFEPEILDLIPANKPYDFSTQLFPKMLKQNIPIMGYVAKGYWCDIGNTDSLHKANADILKGYVNNIDLGKRLSKNIWVGDDVQIAPTAKLLGPIYLGNSVRIKDDVVIKGPTVIRDYSIIDERTQIDRSIIWRNCYIGKGVELRGAMVLRHCSIKSKAVVYEGSIIGDSSIIGEQAIIHPNVKIWSGKEIEPGATIKTSVIWGSQGRRVLFGRYGVDGMVNVDFTPEFSAKLGAAFGATLPKGSLVTFNRDPNRAPRMLKRAAISGLPSAGIEVTDLGVQPVPVARYYTKISNAVGGIHVHLSSFDQMVVNMRFIDEQGLNIHKEVERKIERVFFREDFRRVYTKEIGIISYAPRVIEIYNDGFLKAINVKAIQEAKLNLVVDYASAPTASILPALLSNLHIDVVALNANLNENEIAVPYRAFQEALQRLQLITKALGSNLGVRLDVSGEAIFVVDDKGQSVSNIDLCAAMTELILAANPGHSIAISINLPHIFERIALRHNATIIRTKADGYSLMKASLNNNVVMAADGLGNFIFPNFQPSIDGMMAIAKLLECLATQKRQLSEVIANLPPYYLSQAKVYCLWEAKGSVMRRLTQKLEYKFTNVVEGLKVVFNEGEWILIVPSQDEPQINLTAESTTEAKADSIIEEYTQLIHSLQEKSM